MACPASGTPVPENLGGWAFCIPLGNGVYYGERLIYTGEAGDGPGGCEVTTQIGTTVAGCGFGGDYGDFGCSPASEYSRFWHATLQILDRHSLLPIATLTTVDPDYVSNPALLGSNFSEGRIMASNNGCGNNSVAIPTMSWVTPAQSPGSFYFRPTNSELGQSLLNVESYEEVININKRHIFRYVLHAAYDADENTANCSLHSVSVPDTLDPNPWSITIDFDHAICFSMPLLNDITTFGCCEVETGISGSPLLDLNINPSCMRAWVISVEPDEFKKILSIDLDTLDVIDRGVITNSSTMLFGDIAWDKRGYLWGLTNDGLRRILPGSSIINAIATLPATITKILPSWPDISIVTGPGGIAAAAMGCDPTTGNLYISLRYSGLSEAYGNNFFELQPIGDNEWRMTKFSQTNPTLLGENHIIGDIAFDNSESSGLSNYGYGVSIYTTSNGSGIDYHIAKINVISGQNQGFGSVILGGADANLANVTGMSFFSPGGVLDPQNAVLYGILDSSQVVTIDQVSGSVTNVPGVQVGTNTIGMTSCQIGEDDRILHIPFYPGKSPWVFIIDISPSMENNNRLGRIRTGLKSFFSNYVRNNDRVHFRLYNDTAGASFDKILQTTADVTEVNAWIDNNIISGGGSADLCSQLINIASTGIVPADVKSMIIISDGNSTGCTGAIEPHLDTIVTTHHDVTFYAIGIDPINSSYLEDIGNYDGGGTRPPGGYVTWS